MFFFLRVRRIFFYGRCKSESIKKKTITSREDYSYKRNWACQKSKTERYRGQNGDTPQCQQSTMVILWELCFFFFLAHWIFQLPLIWVFGHTWLFLHHGIEEEERYLLWKFHKKASKETLVKCATEVARLRKVYTKGRLRKFIRAQEIEFNFLLAWTIFMKLGTLVHQVHGYKNIQNIQSIESIFFQET